MPIDTAQDQKEKTETRDRIIRLEMTCEKLADAQTKMSDNLEKFAQQAITRDQNTVVANAELQKALYTMTTNMSTMSLAMADMKDSVKELKMSQDKTSKEMLQVLDLQDEVKKLDQQCNALSTRLSQLETMSTQAKASWKTITVVATVTCAAVTVLWTISGFIAEHFGTLSKLAGH